jgi:hypothetical protein
MDEGWSALIEETFRQFSGGTEEYYKKSQDNRYPGRDSNRTPPNTSSERYGYANTSVYALLVSPISYKNAAGGELTPDSLFKAEPCKAAEQEMSDCETPCLFQERIINTGTSLTHQGVHFKLRM